MSRPTPTSKLRRLARAAAALIALMLLAAACSSAGLPESYTDQPIENEDGETVSLVQDNWMRGCTVGVEQSNLADDANDVCRCSFDELSSPDGIAFEDFLELNNDLAGDPASLASTEIKSPAQQQLVDIVKGCIAG